MSIRALSRWERQFRAAAEADGYEILKEHLWILDCPGTPQEMVEATIKLVRMCSGFAAIDNQKDRFNAWLDMQTYNAAQAKNARYAMVFDICGAAYARVLINTLRDIDLADLYNSPWPDYHLVGFRTIWISHLDWSELTRRELRQIEKDVERDFYFDYGKDELQITFYPDSTYLRIDVQDVSEYEEADSEE